MTKEMGIIGSSLFKWFTTCSLLVLAVICTLLFSEKASAHGYVEGPSSRAYLCKLGQNTNCGAIIYEPQSLEAAKGFPAAGPADGKIASANGAFPLLDQQSSTRWTKVNISSGQVTFNWKLTAAHATTSWKYYITKQNWNPDSALTRASFELTPFCSVNHGGTRPPFTYSDTCNVPSRTGYQVILAVWEIADTANAFYNVIDVNFGSSNDTTAPTAPSSLTVTGVTSTTASLSWGASSDAYGVNQYRIYNGSTLVASVSGSTLSYTATGLTPSTSYSYHVVALDAAGNISNTSATVNATTTPPIIDISPPTAPSGLHVMGSPTSNSLQLMWTASVDNVAVTQYKVYQGSTLVATISGSLTSYTVTGLTPSTTYSFTVYALDAAGNQSPASNAISGTTTAQPTVPAWAPNTAYTVGTLVSYNGAVYSCRQAHTSLAGWTPSAVAALWLLQP
ncbi:lytic polysaccharide monooxygenase [Paenibacillus sp. L3-i20]|uniref:lytic polysaccharide monooxygenase n=1 Tax=Paenibacillus sp. L3-i20 TaxID=2905833 RepID=UPI001EDDB99B|nr:lytic polysaccharide monooxygenase [Paenibacillus sp. L3-i20]GKU78315.1 chitin-binding protein [Paenibacillus sp. L3-i20]